MDIILEDKLGKINVSVNSKEDWISFQREKGKPTEIPVFFGMQISVLKRIFDSSDKEHQDG